MTKIPVDNSGDEILDATDMENLARHLGFVVIVWGMVETKVRELLHSVVMISEPDRDIATAVMSETPFRTQISILRKAAYIKRGDGEWFNKLDAALSELLGPLSEKRNRFVHDAWVAEDGIIVREVRGALEVSIGNKGKRALNVIPPAKTTVADIARFLTAVDAQYRALIDLRVEYLMWAMENDKFPQHIKASRLD
ncbi:hypothetical protein [Novosphingobium terrae]|uniref:hypothetical protein n=1 Tax=Novosphingobium terrae TaxID=2726189 RepID=UPI00198163DE|nr:hypothetical protein [Novosphingobium terrae]